MVKSVLYQGTYDVGFSLNKDSKIKTSKNDIRRELSNIVERTGGYLPQESHENHLLNCDLHFHYRDLKKIDEVVSRIYSLTDKESGLKVINGIFIVPTE